MSYSQSVWAGVNPRSTVKQMDSKIHLVAIMEERRSTKPEDEGSSPSRVNYEDMHYVVWACCGCYFFSIICVLVAFSVWIGSLLK